MLSHSHLVTRVRCGSHSYTSMLPVVVCLDVVSALTDEHTRLYEEVHIRTVPTLRAGLIALDIIVSVASPRQLCLTGQPSLVAPCTESIPAGS